MRVDESLDYVRMLAVWEDGFTVEDAQRFHYHSLHILETLQSDLHFKNSRTVTNFTSKTESGPTQVQLLGKWATGVGVSVIIKQVYGEGTPCIFVRKIHSIDKTVTEYDDGPQHSAFVTELVSYSLLKEWVVSRCDYHSVQLHDPIRVEDVCMDLIESYHARIGPLIDERTIKRTVVAMMNQKVKESEQKLQQLLPNIMRVVREQSGQDWDSSTD